MTKTLRKDAMEFDGHGRGMDNKKPRAVKHQHDRLIDKRRRRKGRQIIRYFEE